LRQRIVRGWSFGGRKNQFSARNSFLFLPVDY